MIEALQTLKEAAPESKLVMSKPIPIGDESLDIERNIFNARLLKKLSEDEHINASLIDHENLSEQGLPIKRYYRQDLVHLAPNGIDVYTTNLRKVIIQVLKKEVNSNDENNQKDTDHNAMPHYRISDEEYSRRKHSEERRSGYSGHEGRTGYHNNYAGQRNVNQLREHNRGYNVNGSIRYQNAYNRMNDSYPHRDENKSKIESYSHRRDDDGRQHGDDYRGYNKKSLIIKVHFRIGMTIHTGVMKADIIGAFITIHILGIAMHIDTWTRTGRGTKLTTGESEMYIMTIGTMTDFNIELETILVEDDIVTVIIMGIVFVSVREV